jgi:MOSC domain-containing protein YiiM
MAGIVIAVSRSATHTFGKQVQNNIRLLAGLGVEGDTHLGATVQHRSRVASDPSQPNLRQVHLIHSELHDELNASGFSVWAGQMGENITTRGINLLALPVGTILSIGSEAVIEITGLRNPCFQLDDFQPGLMAAIIARDSRGRIIRKSGIMGIIRAGGEIRPGDKIDVDLPPLPHRERDRV